MEEAIRINTTIKYSSGIIKKEENACGYEYDLIYYAHFVPNLFNNNSFTVIGEAGFDKVYEKSEFRFEYYPDDDKIVYPSNSYRITIVNEQDYNQYKNNIEMKKDNVNDEIPRLPWIRYPRTKDGVYIPLLIERIFGRIPTKMVFMDN